MLDFRSSGQGRPTVTQLVAEGEILANAIEFTAWSVDPVQVEVCSDCGVERCAPGGWVSPRRAGEHVAWIPAFDELAEDQGEFGPPRYFARRGVPLFEREAAKTLAKMVGVELEDMRPLTSRDVTLLLQWTAPGRLLGAAPAVPRIRREDVLAATSGDRDEALDRLDELLAAAIGSDADVVLQNRCDEADLISFFLDLPDHPEWTPLVRKHDRVELAVGGLVVRPSK